MSPQAVAVALGLAIATVITLVLAIDGTYWPVAGAAVVVTVGNAMLLIDRRRG